MIMIPIKEATTKEYPGGTFLVLQAHHSHFIEGWRNNALNVYPKRIRWKGYSLMAWANDTTSRLANPETKDILALIGKGPRKLNVFEWQGKRYRRVSKAKLFNRPRRIRESTPGNGKFVLEPYDGPFTPE